MTRPQPPMLLAVLNLAGFAGVIVINALANAVPIGGRTTGELSDALPNLFVPAGLTFSIWGLIYLLLAAFVVYGFVLSVKGRAQGRNFLRETGTLLFVTCLANIGWIFAWHYQALLLSLVWMVILLSTLVRIYLRLQVGISGAGSAEKYLVHLPFSVYLGWISIATLANVTAVLVAYNRPGLGMGDQLWASVLIVIGAGLGLFVMLKRNDIFYTLVVNWAILGILIKRTRESNLPAQAVIYTSIAGITILSLGIVLQIARKKVYR